VFRLAFAPDGRTLAGSVGSTGRIPQPGAIILWDVQGRRPPRTLRGHASRITALAYSPDGKTLSSGGADGVVILWDPAAGREVGRLERKMTPVTALAYSPDGRTLTISAGPALELWDMPARRFRAPLETEALAIKSIAFAPGGRSLAIAGTGRDSGGRVWLYDWAEQPPSCVAELTLDRRGFPPPDPVQAPAFFHDVAFTPDGRRVVACSSSSIAIWDAATGAQRDFIDRDPGSFDDRLDLSPDGRWLAVPGFRRISLIDLGREGP